MCQPMGQSRSAYSIMRTHILLHTFCIFIKKVFVLILFGMMNMKERLSKINFADSHVQNRNTSLPVLPGQLSLIWNINNGIQC